MATGQGVLVFRTNYKTDGSYSEPSFRVTVPGDSHNDPRNMQMVRGSWSESELPNGDMQCTFRVWVSSPNRTVSYVAKESLENALEFFAAVEEETQTGLLTNTYAVGQRLNTAPRGGWSRILGGTMVPVDGTALTRWIDDGYDRSEWIITYKRHKYFEAPLTVDTGNVFTTNVYGDQGSGATSNMELMHYLYGPGRLSRTRVSVDTANTSARIKRIWLGIQENRQNQKGYAATFYPSIEANENWSVEGSNTKIELTPGVYESGGSHSGYVGINWNDAGTVDEWRRRFIAHMLRWSGSINGQGKEVLLDHRGRYKLMMRYRTNQPDITNDVKTGIRGVTLWYGGPIPTTWVGAEQWIEHKDYGYHWLDLGEIDIMANKRIDPDYQVDLANFAVGIDAMSSGVPARNWKEGLTYGATPPQRDYGILVERFHLIPADKSLYIELPGGGMFSSGVVDVYMDDNGNISAYGTNGGANSRLWYDVINVSQTNWSVPIKEKSYITGVVDYGDHLEHGPLPRTDDLRVQLDAKMRTKFDYVGDR